MNLSINMVVSWGLLKWQIRKHIKAYTPFIPWEKERDREKSVREIEKGVDKGKNIK